MTEFNPIEIVDMEEDCNLLAVSWNQRFLEATMRTHKLQHRQAMLFVNKAKDRFRLVVNFYGMACLVLPPVNPNARLSLYLKISQFLKQFWTKKDVLAYLDMEIERVDKLLKNRQKEMKHRGAK